MASIHMIKRWTTYVANDRELENNARKDYDVRPGHIYKEADTCIILQM